MKQQKQSGEGEQEQLEIDERPSDVEHGANLDMPAEETKQNQLFSRKGNSNNMLKLGKTATNFLLSPIKSTLKLRGTIISSKGKPLTGEEHLHKSRQNGVQPLATLAIPSPQAGKKMCKKSMPIGYNSGRKQVRWLQWQKDTEKGSQKAMTIIWA
mmetsp:Transcript_35511/g.55631  ORF Transcript_35511/g.55631 Transcript_35511/m.55631 type:complete len:155 (-) Transcript_35511:70-534(-)